MGIRFHGSGSDPGFSAISGPDQGLNFGISRVGIRFYGSGSGSEADFMIQDRCLDQELKFGFF